MHEPRQIFGACCFCPGTMLLLLDAHLLDDGAAPRVGWWQAVEMPFEVFGYLALRFLNEPQGPPVTKRAAGYSYGIRACIPERPESTGRSAEFVETLFAPAQVIALFRSRFVHVIGDGATSRYGRMTLVQPLRCDFTRMVDAHEPGRVPALVRRQF